MALVAVVLIAALLAVGVAASTTVTDRRGPLETLRSHTEPLADAAQRIYAALSFAEHDRGHRVPLRQFDQFVIFGIASTPQSARRPPAWSPPRTACRPTIFAPLTLLTDLSNQLAVYTEIVATARANNRAGRPIGVAYLSGSSALMQHSILPAAERLSRTQSDAVIASERSAGPSRAVVAGAVLVLVLLVLAQASLTRRSHRRLNPGLVLATVLMALLAVWLTVAGLVSTQAATGARTEGGEPLDAAVTARILAQAGPRGRNPRTAQTGLRHLVRHQIR